MLLLLKNLFLCATPFFLLLGVPMAVYIYAGETLSIEAVVRLQAAQPVLFGRAYTDVDRNYKIATQRLRGAEVVALGSSRAMYIRENFFIPGTNFYNAGGAVRTPDELAVFLKGLSLDKHPKIIILGLDQRWFKENFSGRANLSLSDPAWDQFWAHAWKQLYVDYLNSKYHISELWLGGEVGAERRVGLMAITYGNGFREDGSFSSRSFFGDMDAQGEIAQEIKRIRGEVFERKSDFEYSSKINKDSLLYVEEFLESCKKNNITVVGYLSPYAPSVGSALRGDSEMNARMLGLDHTLANMFHGKGHTFYDTSDSTDIGAHDEEFIDPWHGSDKVYARLLLYLAKKDPTLKSIIGAEELFRRMENASGNFEIEP